MIASPEDYRNAARRKLPPFLFDYIDGGSYGEATLRRNTDDLCAIGIRQRVLRGAERNDLRVELFGETLRLPLILAPVGLTGMYARRGERQAALAAQSRGIPFTMSTVSVCPIEEVAPALQRPLWFQLYVLKDRGFIRSMLERARAAGVNTLVFTVDMPVPGARYRDAHSGMSGPGASIRRLLQAAAHPGWTIDVGLLGRPHDLGNISRYRGSATGLSDYIGWLAANFDPSISWADLRWIRDFWPGSLVIKDILDGDDAEHAIALGADGIVVSNHGGRQLDGTPSTIRMLPQITAKVDGRIRVLIDSGFRNGLDVVKALCLGADAVLLGRAYIYALAVGGTQAVENLIDLMTNEIRVAMTLMGVQSIHELSPDLLIWDGEAG